MNWIIENWWPFFTALFLLFLVTSLWMAKVAKHFVLPSSKHFSIFDLELPPSEKSFTILLQDIGKDAEARKSLKQHLLIDFLFMPAAYLGIALLCFKTSLKMASIGKWLFLILAAAQLIAWLLDVIENIYLWRKVSKPPVGLPETNTEKTKAYTSFQFIVKTKFTIAFTGTVCSVFGLLYYWIIGDYQKEALPWLGGLVLLVIVFSLLSKPLKRKVDSTT